MITFKTYVVANVESLRNPVVGDATKSVRETVDVLSGGTAVGVDVASKTRAVLRVTDKEDALNSGEAGAGQLRQRVRRRRSSLRVTLEKEALVRVRLKSGLDLADDVGGSSGGVLRGVGGVDGVIDLATGDLALDVGVHGAEAR